VKLSLKAQPAWSLSIAPVTVIVVPLRLTSKSLGFLILPDRVAGRSSTKPVIAIGLTTRGLIVATVSVPVPDPLTVQ